MTLMILPLLGMRQNALIVARFGYGEFCGIGYKKNRCKVLALQRLQMGGTGLEPATSTV